jgi:hypothetical protein
MSTPLTRSSPPAGTWRARAEWTVSSPEEVFAVREAALAMLGETADRRATPDPARPVFSDVGARLQAAMGELVANGLRHGGPPVRASLARGRTGWLLTVSDSATGKPPLLRKMSISVAEGAGPDADALTGGFGIRMVVALATRTGWYVTDDVKHVWAQIDDEPPPHLMQILEPDSSAPALGDEETGQRR